MRESVGSVFLYNVIFVFIIIVFGLISATISYYKSFKVNKMMLSYINKYSGYNVKSKVDIVNYLSSMGYTSDRSVCNKNSRNGGTLVNTLNDTGYYYCVYYYGDDTGKNEKNTNGSAKLNGDGDPIYYSYGVTTFIYVDLPIVGNFKVPVYTKGERIYNFSDKQTQKIGV